MQLEIGSSEFAITDAVETQIRQQVSALETYVNQLTGCTRCLQHLRFIVVAKAGRVRIHLDVPGGELTIDRQNSADLLAAVEDAFAAARVKLEEHVHQLRHDVKTSGFAPDVRATTIFPTDGYGILETLDGREVYFGRNQSAEGRVGARAVVS